MDTCKFLIVLLSFSTMLFSSYNGLQPVFLGGSVLHQALRDGDLDRVEELVNKCTLGEYPDLFQEDSHGIRPEVLMEAIQGIPGQSKENVERLEDMLAIAYGLRIFTNDNSGN